MLRSEYAKGNHGMSTMTRVTGMGLCRKATWLGCGFCSVDAITFSSFQQRQAVMFGNSRGGRAAKRFKKARGEQQPGCGGRLPAGRSRIPVFELLEQRAMLTGISVTATTATELIADVATAATTTGQTTYTINLSSTLSSGGAYTLTTGALDVPAFTNPNMTLIIDGEGMGETVIDQDAADRVFDIASGATVVLQNLEITGGTADTDAAGGTTAADGGGILNAGTLTLTSVEVDHNKALRRRPARTPTVAESIPPAR